MATQNTSNKPIVIGGENAGVRVTLAGGLSNTHKNLETLAGKNNHWAVTALKEIEALASGHFKNNVYVKPGNNVGKVTQFSIVLPGCNVSVMKRSNGEYLIYAMDISGDYHNSQFDAEEPGFFEVKQRDGDWAPKYIPSGQVALEKDRIVTITDQHEDIKEAAEAAANHVSDAPIGGGGNAINKNGFDMHFTPGKKKIGGFMNANQARNSSTDKKLHESALLLAKTMEDAAKNVKGVSWISERGGSGVLTQALTILKTKGFSFEGTKHHVFFSHITTDLVKVENLARDVGLKFDGKTKSVNHLNPNELVGGLGFFGGYIAAANRFNQDPERHALMLVGDIYKETVGAKNTISTIGISAAAIGLALGVTVAAPPTALAVFAGSVGLTASLGLTFAKAWLPRHYNKLAKLFG